MLNFTASSKTILPSPCNTSMEYKALINFCEENDVALVAVSKTRSVKEIMELYDQGQRVFGENRVQEWLDKKEKLPKDIEWHIIGHLQTNKVKYIIPEIALIHSIDSIKLLSKVDQISQQENHITKVLLQYKVAQEETKFGIDPELDKEIIEQCLQLNNIEVCGLMAMGTFTNDEDINRKEFAKLVSIFNRLKQNEFSKMDSFKLKSMGMSGDFQLAVENGSNMIRVGSLLFK